MKKPIPVPVIVLIAIGVCVVGWLAFSKVSEDPVYTGSKTGYDPEHMPPPPSFKIPPMPGGNGTSAPPPAGMETSKGP